MFSIFLAATLLNAYAAALVLLRAPLFRTRLYRPMLWNIWLSVLPVLMLGLGGLLGVLALTLNRPLGWTILVLVAIAWLLLLPNASYLITELNLSHRRDEDRAPFWYDIILVMTLAMSGVANAVLNVLIAHLVFAITLYGDTAAALTKFPGFLFVAVIMLLLGFGMYLGRYPRFNSWDLKHPVGFVKKLAGHFRDRRNALAAFGFTVTYAVFLALIYLLVAGPVIEGLLMAERR